MASIYKELAIEVSPGQAWAALRRVGDAHRLFAPVLVNAQLDGDVRTHGSRTAWSCRSAFSMSTTSDAA